MTVAMSLDRPLHPARRQQATVGSRIIAVVFVVLLHVSLLLGFLFYRVPHALDTVPFGRSATDTFIEVTLQAMPRTIAAPSSSAAKKSRHNVEKPVTTGPNPTEGATANGQAESDQQGTTVIAPSQGDLADLTSAFQQELQAHIEAYKRYPTQTRGQRPQGTVEVLFEMDRTGIVLGISIVRSSGSEILDRAAMATVLRAQPLPHIPSELPDPLKVSIPIAFAGL